MYARRRQLPLLARLQCCRSLVMMTCTHSPMKGHCLLVRTLQAMSHAKQSLWVTIQTRSCCSSRSKTVCVKRRSLTALPEGTVRTSGCVAKGWQSWDVSLTLLMRCTKSGPFSARTHTMQVYS